MWWCDVMGRTTAKCGTPDDEADDTKGGSRAVVVDKREEEVEVEVGPPPPIPLWS